MLGKMKSPLVSVVIPTYKRPRKLTRALNSVLNQTYSNLEMIVVNDDPKSDLKDMLKFTDDRIRLINHEKHRGGSAARNTGIKIASGDYIAFLDDDDEWIESKIQRQVKIAEKIEANFIATSREVYNARGNLVNIRSCEIEKPIFNKLMINNYIGTASSVMVERTVLKEVGYFDESLQSCQDWDMWLRMAKNGYKYKCISEPLIKYHIHNSDRITTNKYARRQGRKAIEKKYEREIKDLPNAKEAYHYSIFGKKNYADGLRKKAFLNFFKATRTYPPITPHILVNWIKFLISFHLDLKKLPHPKHHISL